MRRYMPSMPSMPSIPSNPFTASPVPTPTETTTPDSPPTTSSATPSSIPDPDGKAPTISSDSDPSTHRASYIPTVPAIPAMRKYLFTGSGTHTNIHNHSPTQELRRRLSVSSPGAGASVIPRRTENPIDISLPELSTMVDGTFGPVGKPNHTIVKQLGSDRLVDALNAGVQQRDRLLLQFLRARHHNAQEALLMIKNALNWRRSVGIDNYLTNSRSNLIKPAACFPMHIISDPNKCKQPVVYGLIRLLDKKKAERVPFHNALLSFLESAYFGDTYILDEMVVILDFRDWSIRRNAPYRLVKDGIQTLQDFYPERLGRVFLVNYPTSIRAAYTAISPIIDAGAKEKIVWVAEADAAATLSKYVAPKSIPSFLGGELEATFPPTWPDIAAEFATATVTGTSRYNFRV